MLRLTHILFAGLGGHGAVVFPMIRASTQEAVHRLIFVGKEELLPAYAMECERLGVPYRFLRTAGGFDLSFHVALTAELSRHKSDAVLVHSTGSLPAALLMRARPGRARTQVLVVEHQAWHLRDQRHGWATRLGLLLANQTIVLQDSAKTHLEQTHPALIRRADVRIIPNGVEIDLYSPGSKQREGPPEGDRPLRIGMQSRLVPIKDHQTLIRAVPLVEADLGRSVVLDLAGDGSSRQSLELLADDLGVSDRVFFRGTLREPELVEFLRGLDIYVHASLGEGMSTALLQAMAVGLPVVASDVPGIAELMSDRNVGVLVPPKDPEALARAISALADDPARRRILGRTSRSLVEADYSSGGMWQSYRRALGPLSTSPLAVSAAADLIQLTACVSRILNRPAPTVMRVWPRPSAPRIAWPVDAAHVGRWFHRTGSLGGGRRSPLLRQLLRNPRAWPVIQYRTRTAEVPQFEELPESVSGLEHQLAAWARTAYGEHAALSFGVNARQSTKPARGVVAVFERSNLESPSAVVKVALEPTGRPLLESEFRAVERIWELADAATRELVPQPLAFRDAGSAAFAAFTCLDGALLPPPIVALRSRPDRRAIRDYLSAVRGISAALRRLPSDEQSITGDSLAAAVDSFQDLVFTDQHEQVNRFAAKVGALSGEWRGCWQHGDLAQGNILMANGSPRAVDWEFASSDCPPWFDEAYAILTLTLDNPKCLDHLPRASLRRTSRGVESAIAPWDHRIDLRIALALTAMQTALRNSSRGRGGTDKWVELALTLTDADRGGAHAPRLTLR